MECRGRMGVNGESVGRPGGLQVMKGGNAGVRNGGCGAETKTRLKDGKKEKERKRQLKEKV